MNIHEEQFIRSFIVESKRGRYLDLIKTRKGRAKLAAGLDHCEDIRSEGRQLIPSSEQTPKAILFVLSQLGAERKCCVISSNENIEATLNRL